MAINIGENQNEQVTYVNSPDINRVLFKNLKEGASKEDIADAVNDWLDDHPEATTTVEDGSILPVKLDSTNSASDGYVLSYNATAGKFEWVDIQSDITELKADLNNANEAIKVVTDEKYIVYSTTITSKKYIDGITGVISDTESNSFRITNYIDISGRETVTVTCSSKFGNGVCAFYDESYIPISVALRAKSDSTPSFFTNEEIPVPNNAVYMVLAQYENQHASAKSFDGYAPKVDTETVVLYTVQSKTDTEKEIARNNINAVGMDVFADIADEIYTPYTITETTSKLITANGIVTDYNNVNYSVTNYIDVSTVSKVKVTGSANFNNSICVFYNSEHEVVSIALKSTTGSSANTYYVNEILTVPSGAVYMVVAACGSNRVLSASYLDRYAPKKVFDGLKWVAVGDSLTEVNSRTTMHYHDYIAEETGITVINMGQSGSGYKRKEDSNNAFYQRVSNIPTDVDVVTIFGSGNDQSYYDAESMGTATDTGTETLGGCINTTIDNIYAILPTVQLGIIAPCPWKNYNPVNHNNGMAQYTELLRQICYNRSIPFLDLYHTSNLRPWDSTFRTLAYSKDDGGGTHPDETGHKLLAGRIRVFLNSLIGQY